VREKTTNGLMERIKNALDEQNIYIDQILQNKKEKNKANRFL
jgi:hypothetical protein